MSARLFFLKLAAMLAALICGGCLPAMGPIGPLPNPTPKPAEVPTARVELIVSGKGSVDVGGAATITAKAESRAEPPTSCNCGCAGRCGGSCGCAVCNCPRGASSAVQTTGNTASSGPQFVTQYRDRVVCENGVCRRIREEVQVPVAAVSPPDVTAATGGQITVYWRRGNPASEAMRAALRNVSGIDWQTGLSPLVNGNHWYPTATLNGRTWVPFDGWHSGSLNEFLIWRNSP